MMNYFRRSISNYLYAITLDRSDRYERIRNIDIYMDIVMGGKRLSEVAKEYNISRDRVSQIVEQLDKHLEKKLKMHSLIERYKYEEDRKEREAG